MNILLYLVRDGIVNVDVKNYKGKKFEWGVRKAIQMTLFVTNDVWGNLLES